VAGFFMQDRVILDRIRTIAFALQTPFFFLRAGTLISASALVAGAGVIGALFAVKMATKGLYALEWGERVLILGGDGRLGQVTPPA